MYYSESNKGLYAGDTTYYIKIVGDIKKQWPVIPLQSSGMTENHQSGGGGGVAPRITTWVGGSRPPLD